MSVIHKHNIEELLFKYHEGLLDDNQKQELLSFLGENPSYNADFLGWGNARLNVEEVQIPMDFSKSLLKKEPWIGSHFYTSIIGFTAGTCIAILGVYFLQPSFLVVKDKQELNDTVKTALRPQASVLHKRDEASADVKRASRSEKKVQRRLIENTPSVATDIYIKDTTASEVSKTIVDTTINFTSRPVTEHLVTPSSQFKIPEVLPRQNNKVKIYAKKKKMPLYLKPAEDFETENSNF